MLSEPNKLTENLLGISWQDSAWIPILTINNVMDYFSERSNPFYDRTCNNEVLKMQRASPDQLQTLQGVEYCLLHVQEPILYVIRKQQRHSPTQVTPIADYYIIAGTVYQAPDLGSVLNSRLLTSVTHMQSAFEEARQYSKYHPSKGYWWDFGQNKKMTEAERIREEVEKQRKEQKKKKKKKKLSRKMEQEKREKEEPSSLFQRRRVDMLLDLLTKRFPPKLTPPSATQTIPSASGVQQDKEVKESLDVKVEKDSASVKSEKISQGGIKREASGSLKGSGGDTKRAKLN